MKTKKVTTVQTVIDGNPYTLTGTLSKDGKILNLKNGIICPINEGDIINTKEIEVKKKQPKTQPVLLDMHKWFKSSKQI